MPDIRISNPGMTFHLGDEYIATWTPAVAQQTLTLTFTVPFIHGDGVLHADTYGVHQGAVHNEVFVNGNHLGHIEHGRNGENTTQELSVPNALLNTGTNFLRIVAGPGEGGGGPNIDDFLVSNIHLHMPH